MDGELVRLANASAAPLRGLRAKRLERRKEGLDAACKASPHQGHEPQREGSEERDEGDEQGLTFINHGGVAIEGGCCGGGPIDLSGGVGEAGGDDGESQSLRAVADVAEVARELLAKEVAGALFALDERGGAGGHVHGSLSPEQDTDESNETRMQARPLPPLPPSAPPFEAPPSESAAAPQQASSVATDHTPPHTPSYEHPPVFPHTPLERPPLAPADATILHPPPSPANSSTTPPLPSHPSSRSSTPTDASSHPPQCAPAYSADEAPAQHSPSLAAASPSPRACPTQSSPTAGARLGSPVAGFGCATMVVHEGGHSRPPFWRALLQRSVASSRWREKQEKRPEKEAREAEAAGGSGSRWRPRVGARTSRNHGRNRTARETARSEAKVGECRGSDEGGASSW